ncbi:TlpA disulfide reductase family protein [Olivibacter sp. 47]|uniref:TlpA family protein disulfide reductase n=1 Tax=Olivibacter sp. 47 TaxID=3056486 RepID=UPI0025A3F5AE|nr:TlpA disulfide reductase family protein [Olivibacter sp. 47]MDM8176594.1 TlpA disulfide reductase family protein [Olivibacter sp. 47]
MKVYDFIGTLLFKNKLFKHIRQKVSHIFPLKRLERGFKNVNANMRKRLLLMSDELSMVSSLVAFARRFLRSALSTSLPSVEMTRGKVGLGSLDRLEVTFGKPAVPHSAKARRALKPYSLHLIPLNYLKPYTIYLTALNVLFCVCLAHARQSSSPEAAHGVALSTDSIKPLQIGDTIPEALWHMPLQTVKAGQEGSTTVKLNDYRGKLIILDFWATWCTACVAAMPDLHQLQAKFETELKVLSVTYEPSDKARQFLENNKLLQDLNIGSITDDNMLKKYFYHKLIPHCVWIDQKGVVRATTRPDAVNAINVSRIIDNQIVGLKMKRDVDAAKPLFLKGDLLVSNKVKHHSIFIEETYLGLPVGPKIHRDNNGAAVGLALCNTPLLGIYDYLARKLFAGKGILYSSKDRYIAARDTLGLGMVYTISLSADTVADMNRVYKNMLNEVNRYSGWKGMIEKRKRSCYVLRHIAEEPSFLSGTDSLKMNTFFKSIPGDAVRLKGYPIKYLVAGINSFVFGRSDDLLVDATGIEGPVDLTLQLEPDNVERLITQLKRYNLTVTKEEIETDVFVIRKSDL